VGIPSAPLTDWANDWGYLDWVIWNDDSCLNQKHKRRAGNAEHSTKHKQSEKGDGGLKRYVQPKRSPMISGAGPSQWISRKHFHPMWNIFFPKITTSHGYKRLNPKVSRHANVCESAVGDGEHG